jgi:NADPH:quinone reductase
MKAWLLDSFTGLGSLHLTDVPDPIPAAGQVLLSIQYAALNPADRYLAQGEYPARPPLPHILGRDGLGRVVATGERKLILRGPVGVTTPGTFAQFTAAPADCLVDIPAGWTDEEAAGAPLVYLTAYQALTAWPDLPAPASVLVTGASGGVGAASVHLAKAMGHTVLALSRDPKKRARLAELGADTVLDPAADWPRQTGRNIDLAIDNIGGPEFTQLLDSLADRGRISCVGRLAGPVPQFNTASLFFRRVRIGGVAVGAYTAAESRQCWSEVVRLLSRAEKRPLVDSVFEFGRLPQAFERLAAGPMGKVLLNCNSRP